jgi:transposase InsO family protein
MPSIHPNARTTPAVRAEIASSAEPTGVLAQRFGVSTETIRKWRQRGPEDCQDRSARPHKLPWKASEEERAIVCALRRSTGFPLDDLTFVVTHFLPHLNRDAVYRILKAEGLNRLPPADRTRKPHGTFKEYEVGFVHLDVKHLPKLRDRDGVLRKRYLYVAIDRASRFVHLAVKDDETTASAVAFLKEAVQAFPFQVTHILTDRGSCFTADGFEAVCCELKAQHRTTRPYTPKTNGMVERFNGRVQREVLGITIYSHADLEILLKGFNRAYNARRQRVLGGLAPDEAVRQRMRANPTLASTHYAPPADPCALPKALLVVAAAKDVSRPDTSNYTLRCFGTMVRHSYEPHRCFRHASLIYGSQEALSRSSTRFTCTADHAPPHAAGMPRPFSPAAIARSDDAPDARTSAMMGRRSAALAGGRSPPRPSPLPAGLLVPQVLL